MESERLAAGVVEFGVLGPLLVRDRDGPLVLASAKQRALLAVLLLEAARDLVPAQRLIDDLWGDDPPPTALKALQVHVSHLRRALGPEHPVVTRPRGYAIRVQPDALDLHRFEAHLVEARRRRRGGELGQALESLTSGLELWRGPALADVLLLGPGASEADRLEGLRAVAVEERLELEFETGDAGALIPELEALIACAPYRERLHALLMRALYRAGRQADALGAFRRARAALVEGLGLEPGPELVRLEAAILAQDPSLEAPAAAVTVTAQIRVSDPDAAGEPRDTILGREAELLDAITMVEHPEVRLVTITGTGGIGKTRMVLELAARLGERGRLVELAGIEDPGRVLPAVAAAVGAREPDVPAIAEKLGREPVVLLLDNFEQVLAAGPGIAALLAAAPSLTVVVSSRAPLHVRGEYELPLQPLPSAAATELFVRRAREHDRRFSPTPEEEGWISEICQRIDRLPLAIELAAARAGVVNIEQIRERIGRRLDLLAGGPRDAPARQQTIRATVAWSHDLLDVPAKRLFEQLSVFQAGWSLEAAEEVAGGWVLDALSTLIDHSLVLRDGSRFRMLETVREFAAEQLAASPEASAVRRRHASWCVALAERAEPELEGQEQQKWFTRLNLEQENLRCAAAWALANGDPSLALRLLGASWRFWLARGAATEVVGLLTRALATGQGDVAARVKALNAVGVLAGASGDFVTAEASFEDALRLSEDLAEPRQMARALANLGLIAAFAGDYATALDRYKHVAAIWQELGDLSGQSVMRQNMAVVHVLLGEVDRAMELAEESVGLARAAADPRRVAATASVQGRLLIHHRPHDSRGPALLREAIELSVALGERPLMVELLDVVAQLATARGNATVAAELIGTADAEHERSGTRRAPDQLPDFEATVRELKRVLGTQVYERRRERARSRDLEAAVESALRTLERALPSGLSARSAA